MSGTSGSVIPERDEKLVKSDEKRAQSKENSKENKNAVLEQHQHKDVAYRDKDGTIKVYEEGKAPFYWVREDSTEARHSITPTESISSQLSGTGESYTEHLRSYSEKKLFTCEELVVPVSPVPNAVLPRKRRHELMPNDFTFRDIDEYAMKAPPLIKENLTGLIEYLTTFAGTPFEKIRAFYIWITHNINYDTSGYFGRAPLQPTDAETVLKTKLTVCEGYCKLFEAFCRFIDIVSKWPGSTHDASVFDNCGLKVHLEIGQFGHLLGDSGYALRKYLLTPLSNPSTEGEITYNRAHSSGRMVVERAFGLLKSRFREIDVPVRTISGYAKAYGYKPGNDVTKDEHNAHAWNAVYLENDWFLLDVTWGAGFVKAREKKYIAKFNNAYFLADPAVFLTDHFPAPVKGYASYENGAEWQLVDVKLSKQEFCKVVNFDKHGKDWAISPVTHTEAIIENIEYEVDIVLCATFTDMLDYIAFIYADERKLDQFTYTYMLTETKVNIHVCLPSTGDFSLQVFGRRKKDGPRADYQPIVKYVLQCTIAYESSIPYPTHHTVYGPVAEMQSYGVSEVGNVYQEAEEGELVLSVKPTRYIDILPKLHFGDHIIDLKEYCFVDYSDCFYFINVIVRLRYEGYYKLELLAKPDKSKLYSPFVTYLIKCAKACTDGVFPFAHEYALKFKCCVLEPLTKHLTPKSDTFVCIKSPVVIKARCNDSNLEKVDDITFEGTIETPGEDCKFSIEGCGKDGVFHTFYTYDTVIPIEL